MDPSVQVAIIGGGFTLLGYVISTIQKTVDRVISQKNFQKSAMGILQQIKENSKVTRSAIETLDATVLSQHDLISRMLQYSQQNAEAAVKMAKIVEEFCERFEKG